MNAQTDISEIIARWDSGDGKPYKGSLIDWEQHESEPDNIGCMCAQGQVLHLAGGWSPEKLSSTEQFEADKETAALLRISRAHAVLLRNINDSVDGAPSIVLTDPAKVLGDRRSKLLDLWWHFDQMTADQWHAARDAAGDAAGAAAGAAARAAAWDAAGAAAWDAAWAAARDAAWVAARAAAWDAAWDAAGDAAGDATWAAAWDAAWDAAGDAAGAASSEIQGEAILFDRSKPLFFLPAFGFKSSTDIPSRPADYGLGIVPQVQS